MTIVTNIFSFIAALLILVSIHEFGHFYVARRCKVKVLRFSIGFGKVLWSWRDQQGTEYAIAALPLGGYVKMLDEREGDVSPEEKHLSFNSKTVWQRIAIVAAGPIANILLAVLLFWGLMLQGERGLIPIVDKVEPNTIAAHAGFESGQEVVAVDGMPTPTWSSLNKVLLRRLGESGDIRFTLEYPDSHYRYESTARITDWLKDEVDPDPVAGLGFSLYFPSLPAVVGEILEDSPASRAGFQVNDRILSVDELSVKDWQSWVKYVQGHPESSLAVKVLRGSSEIIITLIPNAVEEAGVRVGKVGMGPQAYEIPDSLLRKQTYSVAGAFVAGVNKTWETSAFVLLSVKKLILGEISTKNLSGPISIAKVAGASAQGGLSSFVGFVALLSVFLAVFNLLPIPMLDGGHLFYYLIEVIKGKPVSDKVQMLGYQVGLFMIVSLSVLALYNDITRL